MKTGVKVCDAMTQRPVALSSDTSVAECAKTMADNHVGSILVQDKGKVLGIVTEQDLVRRVLAYGQDSSKVKLKQVMSGKVLKISPEKDISEALKMMGEKNIRHLPVVSKNKLVGFITGKDILKIQPQLFEMLADKIELKESGRKPVNRFIPTEGVCELCGAYSEEIRHVSGSMVCPDCAK